jgi:hypothetical protein
LAAVRLFVTSLFIPSVSVTLTRNQNVVPRELPVSDHSYLSAEVLPLLRRTNFREVREEEVEEELGNRSQPS